MSKKSNAKTQRIKTAKPAKSQTTDRAYRRLAKSLHSPAEFNNRWNEARQSFERANVARPALP